MAPDARDPRRAVRAPDDLPPTRITMNEILEFLAARPVVLIPVLLLAAVIVFAVLKRLLKLAAIVAIAGVLYVVLVEYLGIAV